MQRIVLRFPIKTNFENRQLFNSHAVGTAAAQSLGFEIDFGRNPIPGSAA